MKRFIYTLCLPVLLCWSSCSDFIDVRPENSSTYTNYFKTQQHAEALLTELQRNIRGMMSNLTIMETGEIVDKDLYIMIPNRLEGLSIYSWGGFYNVIYQADLILDNAHRFELTDQEMRPYLLQAYFAKGLAYFQLARSVGESPITEGSVTFEKFPQSSITEVLDEAERWALKALELPPYEEMVKTAGGKRMKQYGSKGAVAALLAHLSAWRASVEGKTEYWAKAEEYCRMIIDGETGYYALAKNPEDVCLDVLKGDSEESIWEVYVNIEESITYAYLNDFVEFPVVTTSDSDPTDKTYVPVLFKTTVQEMYPVGDLRRESYFWATDADSVFLKYINNKVVAATERGTDSVIIGYNNREIQRAYFYKYRYPYYSVDDSSEPDYDGLNQNMVIWRLGDIYLLRAECRARQNKANAVDDLNKIRSRAYGDLDINAKKEEYAYPSPDDITKGLVGNIQLAIFREREKELLSENHRYWDIIRNGWCFLRGQDTYDYIRKEISSAYERLTDEDIKDGALYYKLGSGCFESNDLIRQNRYWNRREQ